MKMTKGQIELSVLIQDLVLAFVINTAATILAGGFAGVGSFLIGMFEAFSINYIAGLMIPVERIGCAGAKLFRLKEGSLPFKLIRVFIINAIFVTIISFTIALINNGATKDIFSIWIKSYPILHVVGFLTSLLTETSCRRLAATILNNN